MSEFHLKELKIEVTYRCPLACVHCSSNASTENDSSIAKNKCMEILSDASKIGVSSVAFSGGEPLIWDGITDAIAFCHKRGMKTSVYTSGNVADPSSLFGNLKKDGLDKAIFSIYSPIKEEHTRITRKHDSFDLTIKSMELCRSVGIDTEVHFVALSNNYNRLGKIVEFAESHGASQVSVLRFVPQGRGCLIRQTETLLRQQNLELKKTIESLRKEGHTIRTGSPFNVLWLNEKPKCMAARDRLIVAPDLRIYPCDAFKQIRSEEIVGNSDYSILDKHSLTECWHNSSYLNYVRRIISEPPTKPCGECEMYPQCKSGCAAQKYLAYNTIEKNPDPSCLRSSK